MSAPLNISHPQPPYVFDGDAAVLEFIRANDFGTLITPDLETTHISVHLDTSETVPILRGHIAARNPQSQHIQKGGPAKIVFWGDHGYVSPTVYDDPLRNVPTWNYQTVEVTGILSTIPEDEYRSQMDKQINDYEDTWTLDDFSPKFVAGNFRAIIPFTLSMDAVVGKNKMSQNKSDEERTRMADKLAPSDPILAALIRPSQ